MTEFFTIIAAAATGALVACVVWNLLKRQHDHERLVSYNRGYNDCFCEFTGMTGRDYED